MSDAFCVAVLTVVGTLTVCGVLFGIGASICSLGYRSGWYEGREAGREKAEKDAVAAGAGRWVVRADGNRAFEWFIPDPTKRERDD